MSDDVAKEAAGKAAADLVNNGMFVGLGTGSTAAYFIKALGERCRDGLEVQAVATSKASFLLAQDECIPMVEDLSEIVMLDITVDGADEIDKKKRMIKGGGGALLREKIIASMSQEMIVVVDEAKLVNHLGGVPLPVEIIPFAYQATIDKIERLGYSGSLRMSKGKRPYVTENHNYIFDIRFSLPCLDPESDEHALKGIPGVVETGFFLNLAGRVIVGYKDGKVKILS